VATSWRRTEGGLELDVEVPANATGRIYVPASRPEMVFELGGGKAVPAERAAGVARVGVEGDRVVVEIGSGRYQFRVAAANP
jgi:alpha-L-rhamnosidase